MARTLADKLKWRVGKWVWAPPGEMPVPDPRAVDWMRPEGMRKKRGKRKAVKEPLLDSGPLVSDTTAGWHHRGSTIHRDVNPRHARKASLPFRGKGFKVERRKRRRK